MNLKMNNPDAAASLLAQAALSQATELARAGRYGDAEQTLGLITGPAAPPVLDLLARIRAQQGRLAEAQALWTDAVRLDPNNESYRAALQRLTCLGRTSLGLSATRTLAAAAGAALIVAAFVLLAQNLWQKQRASLVAELRPAALPVRTVSAPQINLQLQGVTQRIEGADIVLRFNDGLFSETDNLTPQAKLLLASVGQKLQPGEAICIVGYSDDLPVSKPVHFRDNRILALARAQTVAQLLASSSGIPARNFTLQGSEASIYPNGTPEDRARNRTVEIRIVSKLE